LPILGLTPQQLGAVLAHEIAHIQRYDYLVNILQIMAETLLFYHPAVWWASGRIRHERELCCDDLAVRSCGDALCYARALTTLEKLRALSPSMAMGSTGGSLFYRIQRLMGETPGSAGLRSGPAL
jgi:beta-lactamase regulating signal transducer with metallopeptidase domain